jgi:mono/diheme cytochrome c family protein
MTDDTMEDDSTVDDSMTDDMADDSTTDDSPEGGAPEGGTPMPTLPEVTALCAGLSGEDQVDCGEYIVNHVVPCGDCHTPTDETGAPLEGMFLAGNAMAPFLDTAPDDDEAGAVWVRNLTPDVETGLGAWTAEEIKTAISTGVRMNGDVLFPAMPYQEFANMEEDDLDAIVAYLMQLPAVDNAVPDHQIDLPAAPPPLPPETFPPIGLEEDDEYYDDAVRGLYIAAYTGACIGCHTPTNQGAPDITNYFAGGRVFNLPSPPFPEEGVYTANLTPSDDGIGAWSPQAVVNALKLGVDAEGEALCPPMPAGPMGAFGGMEDDDAMAVAIYLLSIEGKPNVTGEDYPECVAPGPPPSGEGGAPMSEAGTPEAGTPSPEAGTSSPEAGTSADAGDAGAN